MAARGSERRCSHRGRRVARLAEPGQLRQYREHRLVPRGRHGRRAAAAKRLRPCTAERLEDRCVPASGTRGRALLLPAVRTTRRATLAHPRPSRSTARRCHGSGGTLVRSRPSTSTANMWPRWRTTTTSRSMAGCSGGQSACRTLSTRSASRPTTGSVGDARMGAARLRSSSASPSDDSALRPDGLPHRWSAGSWKRGELVLGAARGTVRTAQQLAAATVTFSGSQFKPLLRDRPRTGQGQRAHRRRGTKNNFFFFLPVARFVRLHIHSFIHHKINKHTTGHFSETQKENANTVRLDNFNHQVGAIEYPIY